MKDIRMCYGFRLSLCLLAVAATVYCWCMGYVLGAVLLAVLVVWLVIWQHRLYENNLRNVLFLLEAIENNDTSIHFSEEMKGSNQFLVNRALNKVAHILHQAKHDTMQREKYYELILDCVNTGIIVLNDQGAVYQKNGEALRLLGLEVFTHVHQLRRVDASLAAMLEGCRVGDKLQMNFQNERGTVYLSVRVSDIRIHEEHLRIVALNDINSELDEKEIDSWIRLTRVLTHEIMNSVTPITSLSDTLQGLMQHSGQEAEVRKGLQTISSTGKGLLAFVENYRKFTRIPTPEPTLFYVKGFLQRMVALARHQYPEAGIDFQVAVTPGDLILHADENLIGQVVINLLKNAIQAIESESSSQPGVIRIQAFCNEAESVLISISNNGPAIPKEVADHIFIPFFTTKEGGSGIGLSVSRQIMRLSDGSLSLQTGKETTFVMQFN